MKNKLLIKLFLLPVFILFGSTVYAQQITVTGIVSDAQGPLPGASIVVKGTSQGTTTDFDGNYSLEGVLPDAILVVSYIGFENKEVRVNGRTAINVVLAESAQALDEVVVIGYGTTTVKDATGSVASVTAEDFNGGVISSPEQLIQGKTAGVQITQSSGEPGAGINIRIRGTGSVRSNNNPLFVVDGVPLSGGGTAGGADLGAGSGSARNPLSFLNPNDIESISILKDASATAIYGSRGANGVVIITTKTGKSGQGGTFELSSNLSYSSAAKKFDLLDRTQFLDGVTQYGGDAGALDFGFNTDWQDVVLRDALSTNHSLSYANNYGSGFVRASLGYGSQLGVIENSSQEKINARINASHRLLDDKLKLNVNATISRVNDEAPLVSNTAGSQGDLLGAAYFANPTWERTVDFTTGSDNNPLQMLEYYNDLANTNRILLNFSAEYAILDNLKAKINLGYDESNSDRNQALSSQIDAFTNGTPGNGRGNFQEVKVRNHLLDLTFTYNKQFGNAKIEALVGYSFQDFRNFGKTIQGFGYSTTDLSQMISDLENAANSIENSISGPYQQYGYSPAGLFVNRIVPQIVSNEVLAAPAGVPVSSVAGDFYGNTDELQSFFGRVNYTIADKYLFTATLRADGSTRFGPDNRYGYFPSGAFAWQIHEEDFVPEVFSNLKLRLGYGITGNQDGLGYGNFTFRQRFASISIDNGGAITPPGTEVVALPEANLRWEETAQAGIGIDFGFLENRLSGTIDLYHKKTKDLLLRRDLAQPAPDPFVFDNLPSSVINKGIEFSINYDLIQLEDITWNAGFNISYNDNMVKDFDGLIQTGQVNGNGLTGAYAQLLAGGQPLFSYYLREFGGFDNDGVSIYPNGDQQEFVGKSALPKVNLGISTNLSYKNWDFNMFWAGQFGHYIYNNTANAFFTAGIIGVGKNVTQDVLTNGESQLNAPDVSTRFLEKGDFLRLQNLVVGYNLKLKNKKIVKSVRLSLTGQNLFVITGYSGLDPEVDTPKPLNDVPSLGIDYSSFPRPRTLTLGLNATF